MKALYPASHDIPSLTSEQLTLKIARHAACTACSSCPGLRPPPDAQVVLDTDQIDSSLGLTGYGSDDEDSSALLDVCSCGHVASDHGANLSVLGHDEFARRGRVGVRCDELLEDQDKLLDFEYADEDILSLRRQMQPFPDSPESSLSDALGSLVPDSPTRPLSPASSTFSDIIGDADEEAPERPHKKRRVSFSSLSEGSSDSDSDEEDRPLAATTAAPAPVQPKRAGKQVPTMKTKAKTAPAHVAPPTEEQQAAMARPPEEPKIKVEEKMDEGQLDRLATGVTVDASSAATTSPHLRPEKVAHIELRKGIIKVVPVENDAQPRSWVILTGLKTLFQKQLPKMPREYIARLVYDSNSRCVAIIKRGYKVVGGICFRPFPHRGFAEIVFFATTSVDQVKGYGSMLMDHFKMHIKRTYPGMMHFLTYADNYAVGYFRKQGFTKEITLDRSVWAGYIKDYEGGTIMQCTMLRNVDYLQTRDIISQQREAILQKIREMSKSHIVYPGLPQFAEDQPDGVRIDPKDVPGLRESGWTPSMVSLSKGRSNKSPERAAMEKLLADMQGHPLAWAFLQPVSGEEVPEYYEVIKKPMDFSTMEHKIDTNQYRGLDDFATDAQLVFENCKTFNPENTIYHKNAAKLEKFLKDQLTMYRLKRED